MSEVKKIATRESYGNALVELGKEHENLVVLDADLAAATKTGNFKKAFPDRFFDCGIAESNLMGVAAGLAAAGMVPFASTFAMFAAGRAFEQVRNSIGYPHLNVKIGATHAGISVGEDGATHQCNEDIALMRTIPGMTIISPSDDVEAKAAVKAAYEMEGPVYLRFGRLAVPVFNDNPDYKFEIGKGVELRDGKDVTIIATIISFTISLLTGISGAVDEADSWYMGGGMELVEVAIKEIGYKEGAGGTNKYGIWCGIGNANWCHAFVSWCANECGFVAEGIIPKTGSCEDGRQWFIKRNEYQERGSYEPAPGDIVYFRHGSETVSHHVGIVEYAENGILHTIEGNSGGVVKRREYSLSATRIMGYGLPNYPDDGYGEFGSGQDFLKHVRSIGQTIVNDGDWIYSNSGAKGNFTDARKAGRHASNCALAISWCMQEFGTLKKNQHLYADWDGNIHCSSATRKRIEKYYEVINVGGKKNANGVRLKPGDICIWNIHVNVYAGEEGGKKVWYDFSKNCISDKKPNSGHYVKYIRKGNIGQTLYKVLRLKDQDSYGGGKQFIVPKGMGTSYTYMGWALIHDWPTRQNYLRKRSGEHYDSHGFAKVNGRYVIACTTTFGKVGDYIDFVLDNGKAIHAIMGDEKNQSDSGCNKWGHDNGRSVVEFVVNKSMWYGHLGNTDITRFHPEWKSRVKMGVNLGKNFFGK